MTKNIPVILGLGAILLLPTGMILTQFSNPARRSPKLHLQIDCITGAETSIAADNTTNASDKLGLAVAELSNLIGEITSDDGRHTDTHTHTVTHNDKTTHTMPIIIMTTGSINITYLIQVIANQV